jgi:hypothetical protein
MTTDTTTSADETTLFLGEAWFDPIEAGIREQIRGFIEGLIEEELAVALGRRRYERRRDAICFGDIADGGGLPAWSPPAPAHRLVRDGRDRRAAGADRRCARLGV